ncbi:NADH:ubiquinone oxidoreductase [Acarospora aff. strigata]|nr:NADH:ubiquinone oxidoreductase [Acarospora aff. strigata]
MPSAEEPPSSPMDGFSSPEDALAHYKSQYEQLEADLADFQASSRELEAELEKDVEAAEKRERQLREKVESLRYEVDEWKVRIISLYKSPTAARTIRKHHSRSASYVSANLHSPTQTKYNKSKAEANTAQNTLQKEITTLRDTNRTIQLKLRDIEVANDDFERQARNTTSSLEDLESKYNVAIERGVMLEEEVKIGEQEREALRIETQRLRDELSDLKIEADITQNKLRRAEGAPDRKRLRKPTPLGPGLALPQSPISEDSPATTTSSPTIATPPAKSTSSTVSDTPTPPSPPMSERSETVANKTPLPRPSKSRLSVAASDSTPRPLHHSTTRPTRHSRGPSIPVSNGRTTPSITRLASHASLDGTPAQGMVRSGSLYQIRGLIGKMQKLEQRVHSARSKLPAPTDTPPRASPRSGSALGHGHVPATVTMRSPKKRTGGSNASIISSLKETSEITPLSTKHVGRLSFGAPPATPTHDRNSTSRPSSRAGISSTVSHASSRPSSRAGISTNVGHGASRPSSRAGISSDTSHGLQSNQFSTSLNRPGSRQSISGARTPLGHYATSTTNESRRPRSSVGGSYASLHGHGHSASVSNIDGKDSKISTPGLRPATFNKNDLAGLSAIPTPTGLKKRQSGGTGLPLPAAGMRRISSSLHHRDDGEMPPPERRKKLSGVGESY